jgi:hypothetical protein
MHAAAVAGGCDSITVLLTVNHQDEKHCVQQDKANEFQIRPGMGRDLVLELARAGLFNHDPSTGILRLNALLSDGQGGRNEQGEDTWSRPCRAARRGRRCTPRCTRRRPPAPARGRRT